MLDVNTFSGFGCFPPQLAQASYNYGNSSSTDAQVRSFTGVSYGKNTQKYVVTFIAGRYTGSYYNAPTVKLDGVTQTLLDMFMDSGTTPSFVCAYITPSAIDSQSGTIEITGETVMSRCFIGVYEVIAPSATPTDTKNGSVTQNMPITGSVTADTYNTDIMLYGVCATKASSSGTTVSVSENTSPAHLDYEISLEMGAAGFGKALWPGACSINCTTTPSGSTGTFRFVSVSFKGGI
jgi:hypothetical protein